MSKSLFIGIDFDGTMVKHAYPEIGEEIDLALDVVLELQRAGHKIILFTMRSGERLNEAVEYLEENGVELFGVNENKTQKYWTQSPKVHCHIYIDDCALGVPLEYEGSRAYVDWSGVRELLVERELLCEN